MELEFTNSSLWLVAIIILAAFFTYLLYGQSKAEKPWQSWILSLLRFLSFFLIGLLLLNPLLKKTVNERIQKKSMLFVDDSKSMGAAVSPEEQEQISKLVADFKEIPNTQVFYFSDYISGSPDSIPFRGNFSDLSLPFEYINQNYASQEIANLAIISDGIQNRGLDPRFVEANTYPIYTIGVGDTTASRDVRIDRVLASEIAFLGDDVQIEVDAAGNDYPNRSVTITLEEKQSSGWQTLKSESKPVSSSDFFQTLLLRQSFSSPGLKELRVKSTFLENEKNTRNNYQYFQIEVIDNRQKLEILTYTTHPDIGKIVAATEKWKNYKTSVIHLGQQEKYSKDASLYVLYDIPNKNFRPSSQVLKELVGTNKPLFIISSADIDLAAFNQSIKSVRITPNSVNSGIAISPRLADNFTLFKYPAEWTSVINGFTPLQGVYAKYIFSSNPHVLLYQNIGNVETKEPLLFFINEKSQKIGVLAANNIFRWPLYEYALHENHEVWNDLLSQIMQYLSTRDDNKKLRARVNKKVYELGEKVYFSAELYNDSYETITNRDVLLELRDSSGQMYSYTFTKSASGYSLAVAPPNTGRYTYTVKDGGAQHPSIEGNFIVVSNQQELANLQADFALLKSLSERSNGEFGTLSDGEEVLNNLAANNQGKPFLISQVITLSLLDQSTILWILLILLCSEWILRRLWIGY